MLKINEYKGITLIALVISIIVLLILAGVTINAISGSENAMEKATEAKEKNEQGAELEAIKMAVVNSVAGGLDGLVDTASLKSELNGLVEEQGRLAIDDSKSSWEVIGKETKIKYEINKNGNVIVKSGITLSTTKIEFTEELTEYTLEATLSPDLKGTINWSIPENNGVASISTTEGNSIIVSKTGESGSTTITATLNGTSYPATCDVEIVTPPQVGDYIVLGDAITGIGSKTGNTANEDDWAILYDGRGETDNNIKGLFCILADYLPNDNSVISVAGLNPVSGTTYSVISTSQGALIASLKDEEQTAWKQLVSSTILGKYYSSTKVVGALTGDGTNEVMDKIKAKNGSYYRPHTEPYDNCYGYWLASPYSNTYVKRVKCENGNTLSHSPYSNGTGGVCPVVILPSDIPLKKESGVWTVDTIQMVNSN